MPARLQLRYAGLLACVIFLLGMTGRAVADAGDFSDPDDTNGALDVAKVSHSDDEENVTYRVEMHDGFDVERDFFLIQWDFDLDGDGVPQESCIQLEQIGNDEGGLQAALYPGCGPETYATAAATRDGNAIEVRFPLRDVVLGAALPANKKFAYRVTAKDRSSNVDIVPNDGLVEQGGLPEPPAPEQPAQVATQGTTNTETAAQGSGIPPGEGPGVPGAQAQPSTTGGVGTSTTPSRRTSATTWLLALGVPGVVLAAVVLVSRRRRGGVYEQPRLDPEDAPVVPALVSAGPAQPTAASERTEPRIQPQPSAADLWYLPSNPAPEAVRPDQDEQSVAWSPWSAADPESGDGA